MKSVLLIYALAITYCAIVFAFPIYQFVIIPCFSQIIPSMFNCIWIGLMAVLVVSFMTTLINYIHNGHDFGNVSITEDIYLSFIENINLIMN